MDIKPTSALIKIAESHSRITMVQGGTSASKTFSILLIIIDIQNNLKDKVISIVSESYPHLRKGAMRDYLNILKATGRYKEENHNKTDSIYTDPHTGTIVEFFGVEAYQKVAGSRRDYLFVNEANNIGKDIWDQLEVRTRQRVWIDFNPVNVFWAHEVVQPRDDCNFLKLTYRDNEALEPSIVDAIERRKDTNPNWYRVYGMGEIGHYEGQVYSNWDIVDVIPKNAKFLGTGLDFGYTNDPSALADIHYLDGEYFIRERAYSSGLSNKDIADLLAKGSRVVADSAEPKSIDEIESHGIEIVGCQKGKDSVRYGIQAVQGLKLHITADSTNIIKDFRGYSWKKDRAGNPLAIPAHDFSHSPDAIRYFLTEHLSEQQEVFADDGSDFFVHTF